jgi:hypothetical protein
MTSCSSVETYPKNLGGARRAAQPPPIGMERKVLSRMSLLSSFQLGTPTFLYALRKSLANFFFLAKGS